MSLAVELCRLMLMVPRSGGGCAVCAHGGDMSRRWQQSWRPRQRCPNRQRQFWSIFSPARVGFWPVPVVENISAAPAVIQSLAPVVQYIPPLPTVFHTPVLVMEYSSPVPAVFHAPTDLPARARGEVHVGGLQPQLIVATRKRRSLGSLWYSGRMVRRGFGSTPAGLGLCAPPSRQSARAWGSRRRRSASVTASSQVRPSSFTTPLTISGSRTRTSSWLRR